MKVARNKLSKGLVAMGLVALAFNQAGCATQSKKVAIGMLAGAVVGAGVGYEFVHHGDHKQYETRNTIITSVVFALLTGGALAWHYQELEEQKVEISGRYARYRLCDPNEMSDVAKQLDLGNEDKGSIYQIQPSQIGKLAITLDDNTKWVYPVFRKRYLLPERAETQVLSKRYLWEIIRPGSFVTRSENPQYFFEVEEKK